MRFFLSGNLLRFCNYHREIAVEAETVYDGVIELVERHPDLRTVLLDSHSEVRGVHRLFLDGELIAPGDLQAPVTPDADVTILTAIAGG